MKNYKVKALVKEKFNDARNGNKYYEEGDTIILDKARYEELYSKGYLEKGEQIKEKIKKQNDEDKDKLQTS